MSGGHGCLSFAPAAQEARVGVWRRVLPGAFVVIHHVLVLLRNWRERRRSLEALARLSDWQLRDLGVCRPTMDATLHRPVDAA